MFVSDSWGKVTPIGFYLEKLSYTQNEVCELTCGVGLYMRGDKLDVDIKNESGN